MQDMKHYEFDGSVLLVDDEINHLDSVNRLLLSNGYKNTVKLSDGRQVMAELEQGRISVVLLDWVMPLMSGAELLPKIVACYPDIPVIIMTAVTDSETVVNCIRQGAFDFVTKPVDDNRLLSTLRQALLTGKYENQVQRLTQYMQGAPLARSELFSDFVAHSAKMVSMLKVIEAVAATTLPILITGETGVGKELVARAIHRASGCQGEFVPVNVAGLDDEMFTDTLFGHVKGAYTGATTPREGLVRKAAHGTLFFDEIGDLGATSQVKLLRLLQEREYLCLGSDKTQCCQARIVTASNRDFEALQARGDFRSDLFYRIKGYQIHVPSLRERNEDISSLVEYFIRQEAGALGRVAPNVDHAAMDALLNYDYPGNVRELIYMVRSAVTMCSTQQLSLSDFPELNQSVSPPDFQLATEQKSFRLQAEFQSFPSTDELERLLIGQAMNIVNGKKVAAAQLLGMSRTTLNKKLGDSSS